MPRYQRYYLTGHPVFLTIVTHHRQPLFAKAETVKTLLQSMRWAKSKYPFRHMAHVILRDHLHWILKPDEGILFSDLVAAVKRDVTWRLRESGHTGPFWQKRFYDHIIRNDDDFGCHLDYVHYNPVKHGQASRPLEHPWSSFQEWVSRGVYPSDWGVTEPERIKTMDLE
ncbi:MAG: transposase [Gammaproteobacteria bacterium]|nr:transposase [Gammaproteobacteria bacterium]